MGETITLVDAFTDRPTLGNPAAVCILPTPRSDTWMQTVAAEMNLSETAFLVARPDGFDLRWFTPMTEVPMCGHATLASAHVLWSQGILSPDTNARFHTCSGILTAVNCGDWIEIDLPAQQFEHMDPSPDLVEALGVPLISAHQTVTYYLVEVENEETVQQLNPNLPLLKTLPTKGIIVTSRSADPSRDFVSRFFAPSVGIDEDPVTGSSHCSLGPFWATRLNKTELTARQLSARGGDLRIRLIGDRVIVGGQAVTTLHLRSIRGKFSKKTDDSMIQDMTDVASASYRLTTDGKIVRAFSWQSALYDRLSARESEAGYLLSTPTGCGKTESVIIPSLGLRRGGAPRRLFLIGPDGATLDDYLYRLIPYLRASATADEMARTLYVDNPGDDSEIHYCWRFLPDGTEDRTIISNPLEDDVDLVLTTFEHFRELFFGAGGVHALPSALALHDSSSSRRDLFFFDEAHQYTTDDFVRFHRLVEFLFAEDMDVVVGSSTMPAAFEEEMSFLEPVSVTIPTDHIQRSLTWLASTDPLTTIETEIRHSYFQNSRVFGVTESNEDAEELYQRLATSYPHSVYLYHPGQPNEYRRRVYAQLRELEKEGEGYLVLTTGSAIETSDLDASILVTTVCPPEKLILRAGRCNRRGELSDSRLVVVGDKLAPTSRPMNAAQSTGYLNALRNEKGEQFDVTMWKAFI